MEWISVKDRLPKISYIESDNEEDPYESYPVLVFCTGECCVAYLVKDQDQESWNFGDLSWEVYVPGAGGDILEVDFSVFTHWMPLPKPPEVSDE